MVERMIFSDAVYGIIEVPRTLVKCVVDRAEVQRLRRIKQLGMGHLVYPSHEGSRFQHSLGAAHLVAKAIDNIDSTTRIEVLKRIGEEGKELEEVLDLIKDLKPWFQFFMLVHDVGHGPLSHNYEDAIYEAHLLWGLEYPAIGEPKKLHEAVSKAIAIKILNEKCKDGKSVAEVLCQMAGPSAKDACREDPVKAIWSLVEDMKVWKDPAFEGARAVFSQLSSGEVDVDRGDYLMRDAILAGTRMGLFDYERLYSLMVLVPWEGSFKLAVIDKGVPTIESMLLSRFYMYENVYTHKTNLLYTAIASRLMAKWLIEGKLEKIWEIYDKPELITFDDLKFYNLLIQEQELEMLKEVVISRRHDSLRRIEVINATVNGDIDLFDFSPYEIGEVKEVVKENPSVLVYGAKVRTVGKEGIPVFLRKKKEVIDVEQASTIIRNLRSITHIKLYVASTPKDGNVANGLAERLREKLRALEQVEGSLNN